MQNAASMLVSVGLCLVCLYCRDIGVSVNPTLEYFESFSKLVCPAIFVELLLNHAI